MTAVTPVAYELHERGGSVASFLVEDVERGQADIADFFLMESDLIASSAG
jgi:hypothetical protein